MVFDRNREFVVRNEDQYSKCGWSPYEGVTLKGEPELVMVNGRTIYKDRKFI